MSIVQFHLDQLLRTEHESEIHPRINQQMQEDIDGEYESDSKEPNVKDHSFI